MRSDKIKNILIYISFFLLFFLINFLPTSCVNKDSDIANTNPELYHTKEELGTHFEDENFRCDDCHKSSNYEIRECFECHTSDFIDSTVVIYDHSHNLISRNCEECHTMVDFTFDYDYHSVQSNIENKNITCIECHTFDYIDSTNWTDHLLNDLSQSCEDCHDTLSWFNLTYDHKTLEIGEIHSDPNNVSSCYSCHMNDYIDNTDNCNICHLGEEQEHFIHQSFTEEKVSDCYSCHKNLDDWKIQEQTHPTFNISVNHSENECFECHLGMQPEQQSMICFNCHYEEFATNHSEDEDKECLKCHTAVVF